MSVSDIKHMRVVVGMSGGVDSSMAAAILKEKGYEVIGITLKLWPQDCSSRTEDKCCGPQAVMDARAVCDRIGIPFYVADEAEEFKSQVIQNFIDEYRAGRTPNPCVLCNDKLKFGALLSRARKLGADFVATGHYARLEKSPDQKRILLKRGLDPHKDQSYFLFSLRQEQLAHALMPLGELTKAQIRCSAKDRGLKTAQKKESMEICFVPDNNYAKFLEINGIARHQGEIVDAQGAVLGFHDGIERFTIGQRKGLRVSSTRPLYVVHLDPALNRVVLGDVGELDQTEFFVERCNYILWDKPPESFDAVIKVRYRHPGSAATVFPLPDNRARIVMCAPQRAITPGQACVFYHQDVVIGGGWICRLPLDASISG